MPLPKENRSRQQMIRALAWIGVGAVVLVVIAFLAMKLPNRVRLLGLYSVAQGLLTGLILGYALRTLRVSAATLATLVAFVLGACGIGASAWFAFDKHIDEVDREIAKASKPNPGSAIAARVLSAKPPENATPEELKEYRDMQAAVAKTIRPADLTRLEHQKTFQGFLEHRVTAIGFHSSGAIAVWVGEIIAAAIACCLIVMHFANQLFCDECDQWFVPIRAHLFTDQSMGPVASTLGIDLTSDKESPKPTAIYVAMIKCKCESKAPHAHVLVRSGKTVEMFDEEMLQKNQKQLAQHIDQAQGLA
jgi:hypothetical protein